MVVEVSLVELPNALSKLQRVMHIALYNTVEYQLLLYATGTFVLVPILSGFWSEFGKDLYAWLKARFLG